MFKIRKTSLSLVLLVLAFDSAYGISQSSLAKMCKSNAWDVAYDLMGRDVKPPTARLLTLEMAEPSDGPATSSYPCFEAKQFVGKYALVKGTPNCPQELTVLKGGKENPNSLIVGSLHTFVPAGLASSISLKYKVDGKNSIWAFYGSVQTGNAINEKWETEINHNGDALGDRLRDGYRGVTVDNGNLRYRELGIFAADPELDCTFSRQ